MLVFLVFFIIAFAVVAICYGLLTLIVKLIKKDKYLPTLILAEKIFGEKWGIRLHYVFFTILPLLIGIWLLLNVYFVVTNQHL